MDRIPETEGSDAAATDDSIDRQASPPIVSFEGKTADSKTQSAQIAAGVMLSSVNDGNGGDGDRNSIATSNGRSSRTRRKTPLARLKHVLMTFGKFVGPGFMVSVAYSKFKVFSRRCYPSDDSVLRYS
jgi:metal iron transporter